MPDKYARIIATACRMPWAIEPSKLAVITEILRFRAAGHRWTSAEIRARIGDDEDRPRPAARTAGVVAIVPIWGVIAHRTFEASSGMTSTEAIARMFRRAVADDEVKAVILDVSSPGGGVEGVPELGAEIFAARTVKPIVAVANAGMASAAYWLGSQAHEIVVTPSGSAGSIGVYALHVDESGWLEKEGLKVEAFAAGDRKLEFAPWAPLDDEARAFVQAGVDAAYRDFLRAVARGRGRKPGEIESDFGQGRVFDAKEAKEIGLVDRIATLDETIARLAKSSARVGGGRLSASVVRTLEHDEDGDEVVVDRTQLDPIAEESLDVARVADAEPDTPGTSAPTADHRREHLQLEVDALETV